MTAIVDASIVERTWQRLGELPEKEMLRLQRQNGKLQPELVAFVMAFTSDLSGEAVGLALYVMIAVLEMFRSASPKRIQKVNEATVMRLWRESQAVVLEAHQAPPGSDPFIVLLAGSSEPAVLEYVLDAFTDSEQEDPVELSAEELDRLVAVLRALVEGLHNAYSG